MISLFFKKKLKNSNFNFMIKTYSTNQLYRVVDTELNNDANISVVQYNILAGTLGKEKYFPYVKKENLDWEYRREKIFRQIKNVIHPSLPDFVCLQEIDDYWTFFQKKFAHIGLDSVYIRRPSTNNSVHTGN